MDVEGAAQLPGLASICNLNGSLARLNKPLLNKAAAIFRTERIVSGGPGPLQQTAVGSWEAGNSTCLFSMVLETGRLTWRWWLDAGGTE